MALLIGGVGMGDQEKALEKGVDVLIATPGRLLDWFDRGKVLLGGVNILVIDEADRMLDMGFMPDVERILSLLTGRRQTLLFSATMPPGVRRIIERFLQRSGADRGQPARPPRSMRSTRCLVPVPGGELKRRALVRLIAQQAVSKAIVFANRKRDVSSLNRFLQSVGPQRARHPRRPRAGAPAGDAGRVQGRRGRLPGGDRRGGARPRHLRHAGRDQFRRAVTTPTTMSTASAAPAAPARAAAPSRLATAAEVKSVAAIERLIGKPIRRLELPGAECREPASSRASHAAASVRRAAAGAPAPAAVERPPSSSSRR